MSRLDDMIQPLIEDAKRRLAEHQAEVDRLTKFLEAYEPKDQRRENDK